MANKITMITELKKKLSRVAVRQKKAVVVPSARLGQQFQIMLGSDPEFFFKKANRIVGAEKILTKKVHKLDAFSERSSTIIIDGVQGEMNPLPSTCRQSAAQMIGTLVLEANKLAKAKKAKLSFNRLVKITKKELGSLKPENRLFGCDPTLNAYGESMAMPDPNKYLFRAAGGHIHVGRAYGAINRDPLEAGFKDPVLAVKIMDIIAGNTMVLIDRDKGNVERRKVYGRAGEYRLPPHGIEYRVLSNFWITNRVLAWFAFGLVRQAMNIASNKEIAQAFIDAIPEEDVRNAINRNDAVLARKNYERIKPIIAAITKGHAQSIWVLSEANMELVDRFIEKGPKHWFKNGPIAGWRSGLPLGVYGFESFLAVVVSPELKK